MIGARAQLGLPCGPVTCHRANASAPGHADQLSPTDTHTLDRGLEAEWTGGREGKQLILPLLGLCLQIVGKVSLATGALSPLMGT